MSDDSHTIILTPEAFAKFIEICENPPPPTQELIDLFKKYGSFAKDTQRADAMSDHKAPNPNDFSRNDKPGEYTAKIEVRGTLSISIKADSQEDAQRQVEAELKRIDDEKYVEIEDIYHVDLESITKDRPMYRVTREGKPMQVSHLKPGDRPRDPDPSYGF